jgi:CHAT domain-containing protein
MHKIGLLISCLLLVGILLLTAQQEHDSNACKKFYTLAENYFNNPSPTDETDSLALLNYQQTISLLQKQKINDTLLLNCYTRIGILFQAKNDDAAALTHFALAVALKTTRPGLPDSLFFKPLLFAGASYYSLSNFDSALYFFKKAETIATQYPVIDEVERLYNKMGALCYQTGNYKQSINYFNKSISSLDKARPDYREVFIQYKINLGFGYFKLKDYEQAMAIYKELLPFNSSSQPLILHNMGIIYLETGDYRKALHTLLPLSYNQQIKLTDLARLYINLQQPDSAKFYLDSAIAENKKINGSRKNITQGLALKYYGDYFTVQHYFEKAISCYQQAIIQLDPDFFKTDPGKNPLQFNGLHSSFNLFNVLVAKAQAFTQLYQQTKIVKELIAGLAAYKAAFALAKHVERFLDTDEARLFLKKNVEDAYAAAIQTAIDVYELTKNEEYLTDAFTFSETNKASILELNRQQLQIEQIPEIPQALVHEENNIKANIATLTLQAAGNTDSSKTALLQQSIAEYEIKLSKIQEQLNENPRYHQLRYDDEPLSVKKIQTEILNDQTALISYYFTATTLVTFVVTAQSLNYHSTAIDSNLYKEIVSSRTALESPGTFDKSTATATGKKLFNQLLLPVFDLIQSKKQLIIIPHNELHYIPFEILVNPNTSNYLVKDFAISYNYAASFLEKNNHSTGKKEILAFAPFASGQPANDSAGPAFAVLPASKKEVASLPGKIFLDTAATKDNFLQNAAQYPIIHLATHAQANDKNPLESFIAFYPQKNNTAIQYRLYEPEIYNLRLNNSSLVILSACETGKGQLINGEGLMSLSRAFSYAGCPSVITSLWKAEDNATAYLTQKLYYYLQKGFAKDEALQKAKLDYLNDDTIAPNFKTPNFWAHLILVGDASPVNNNRMNYWYIFGGIAFLLCVFFIIKRNGGRKLKTNFSSSTVSP